MELKDSRSMIFLLILINMLPNRDEASEMSDLGANHLLIVRRLEVVNEPFDHLVFHHRGLNLCG